MKAFLLKTIQLLSFCLLIFGTYNCKKKDPEPVLVGSPGNPRFNLQFDNEENVDLDLYVRDPTGETIYYSNTWSYSGGELDVDCLCDDCPRGPNENIFWPEDNSAPKGIYTFWVDYYDYCGSSSNRTSSYTVRVTNNKKLIATYTGSLSGGESQRWTYEKR